MHTISGAQDQPILVKTAAVRQRAVRPRLPNNAVYVHWCGKIGWTHSEALGIHLADYQRLDRGMAIRRADYHYLLPTTVGDELTLGTWLCGGDGKLTIERRFQLVRNRDHATVLRGCWKLVCIELSSGRPRRMPPEFCSTFREATESQGTTKL